jgi:Pseudouridylate synthases, 23S RNA-specific
VDAVFKEVIAAKSDGLALLDHLAPCIPYLTAQTWASLLQSGQIEVDGRRVFDNQILKAGQQLKYTIEDYQEAAVDCHWQLLWQSEDIFALHKPANLPVSRTTRNVYNTLIQLVRRESPWPDAHLLHRLDLETSGIILLAKTKQGASRWQPKISQLLGRKVYHALVQGKPEWQQREFACALNTRKDSPIRCQMHVCAEGEKGKASATRFKVLSSNTQYSIIECQLLSGRKHQIRAHLAHLGLPIVGDKIYGNDGDFYLKRLQDQLTQKDWDDLQTQHHLLHAYEVDICLENNTALTLTDKNYPQQWLEFCHKHQLASH